VHFGDTATFPQHGEVDWVALSHLTIKHSIGILARLDKAGIAPYTLQAGQAICSHFDLHVYAQLNISNAMSGLKMKKTWGKLI